MEPVIQCVDAKGILTKSDLPVSDYSVNLFAGRSRSVMDAGLEIAVRRIEYIDRDCCPLLIIWVLKESL